MEFLRKIDSPLVAATAAIAGVVVYAILSIKYACPSPDAAAGNHSEYFNANDLGWWYSSAAWTAIFICLLTASTIGLWYVTLRTLTHSQTDSERQAKDTKKSLQISARAADAAVASLDRPWLFMDPPTHNALSWVSSQTDLETMFSLTNYGKAPAFIHFIWGTIFLSTRPGMILSDIPFDVSSVGGVEFPSVADLQAFRARNGRVPMMTPGTFRGPLSPKPDGGYELVESPTIPFVEPLVVGGESQSGRFRIFGKRRFDPPAFGIPIQHLLPVYFIGIVRYTGPDGEMQQIDFCYGPGSFDQFQPFAAPPYNSRHKADA